MRGGPAHIPGTAEGEDGHKPLPRHGPLGLRPVSRHVRVHTSGGGMLHLLSLTVEKNNTTTQVKTKSGSSVWFFSIYTETEHWAQRQLGLPSHRKPTYEAAGSGRLSTPLCERVCGCPPRRLQSLVLPTHHNPGGQGPTMDMKEAQRLPHGAVHPCSCPSGSAAHRLVRKRR